LPTRDKQEVTRTARDMAAKRRRMFSESDSDAASGSDDDDGKGKKTDKKTKDPFEFKVPNERARTADGRRRKKRFWTDEEIELLLEGVRTYVFLPLSLCVCVCVCVCASFVFVLWPGR
jgi:hypothetical protein